MTIPEHPTPAEFEHALRRGLGRALLWLRTHDAEPWRDIITECLTQNTAYDPQFDRRVQYLFEALVVTGDPASYLPDVLSALAEREDKHDCEQLLALAEQFALNGHQDAKTAIYQAFERLLDQPYGCETVGADTVVALDGVAGLLHVARIVSPRLPSFRWTFDLDLMTLADGRDGEGASLQALSDVAAADPAVAAWLRKFGPRDPEPDPPERPSDKRPRLTYKQVKAGIGRLDERLEFQLAFWGARAAAEDFRALATDLLAEGDPRKQEWYLRAFRLRPWPLDISALMPLVQSPDPGIAYAALYALRGRNEPEVRELGHQYLKHPTFGGAAVRLLEATICADDLGGLSAALEVERSEEDFHDFASPCLSFFAKDDFPFTEAEGPILTLIYEQITCAECRQSAFEDLLEHDTAPDWMVEEACWDSRTGDDPQNPRIRELARAEWAKRHPTT